MTKQNLPLAAEGEMLRKARGSRTSTSIARAVGISLGRYQNYERGANAPRRELWEPLSAALGIDVAQVYNPKERDIDRVNVAPEIIYTIISELQAKLDILCSVVGKPVSDKVVRAAGYKKIKRGRVNQ
jgi:transcriptional regulator with XRE-family HTH domain